MTLDDRAREFLERTRSAAMTTLRPDGSPHTVRVGVALVDGKLWSSGTRDRARTAHLRRDPRCGLFVFDPGFAYLSIDARVRILDGSDAQALNLRLFRVMQGKPSGALSWFGRDVSEDEFLVVMAEERRLIYEFDVVRSYGMF